MCVCCFRLVGTIHLRDMPSLSRVFRLDRWERYLRVSRGLLWRWGLKLPSLPRAFRLDRWERYLHVSIGLLWRWGFELRGVPDRAFQLLGWQYGPERLLLCTGFLWRWDLDLRDVCAGQVWTCFTTLTACTQQTDLFGSCPGQTVLCVDTDASQGPCGIFQLARIQCAWRAAG
jgi:hypothetical protein